MGRMERRKPPPDEVRDFWENRAGRWVTVHGIARRTLFDPTHDEQPFCHNLTDRRRTSVKFLGQQSERMIDDTCPQTGGMRSLWKARQSLTTWEPNRRHGHILPLFRSHLTRDTAAMIPLFQNPIASTEHGVPGSPLVCCITHRECRGRWEKRGFGVAKISQCVQ